MARPRDPTALKILKGKSHMTKDEKSEAMDREIYAADGEIAPPSWLKGAALKHFDKNAAYMNSVNRMAGVNVYGSTDIEPLAMMSVSYQKSMEHLKAEKDALDKGDSKAVVAAQKNRLAEDKNYREFAKMLKLDPGNRVDIRGGGDDDGEIEF